MAPDQKISLAFEMLREAEEKLASIRHILEGETGDSPISHRNKVNNDLSRVNPADARIVEGIFDGQSMLGEDKKVYPVPANYASKSKLVEGDTLKLTVLNDGSFIFKQIGPVERKHVKGILDRDERGEFYAKVGRNNFRVLTASVTYYKGMAGDEITLIIPQSGEATWGAVENVIKNTGVQEISRIANNAVEKMEVEHAKAEQAARDYDKEEEQSIPIEESIKEKNPSVSEE